MVRDPRTPPSSPATTPTCSTGAHSSAGASTKRTSPPAASCSIGSQASGSHINGISYPPFLSFCFRQWRFLDSSGNGREEGKLRQSLEGQRKSFPNPFDRVPSRSL